MKNEENNVHKKGPSKKLSKEVQKDDILNIARQFISYFEEVDRSEKNGNSISNS